jgi:hypothetical protein
MLRDAAALRDTLFVCSIYASLASPYGPTTT